MNVVASCANLAATGSAGVAGSFLPSVTTYGKNSVTYNWEWATTQGNGTYKSMGFTFSGLAQSRYIASHPNITNLTSHQNYMGYTTSGSDKILYFRKWGTSSNNIVAINETTTATSEILSLDITGGIAGATFSHAGRRDTFLVNDNFYTLTAITNTNFTFKKAPKSTLTYGSTFNIPYTTVGGGSVYVQSMTADERYIYIFIHTKTPVKSMLVIIDTTTDTVASVNDITSYLPPPNVHEHFYSTYAHILKCPFNADYLWLISYNIVASLIKISSITSPPIPKYTSTTANYSADLVYLKDGGFYIKSVGVNNVLVSVGSTITSSDNYASTIFRSFGITNNLGMLSYAEFPTPIIKTSAQAMRIQYTMNL